MQALRKASPETALRARDTASLYDARFRRLLPPEDWDRLPPAVQRRFSKRIEGEAVALYRGTVLETRHSFTGRIFAQLCRLIGAPLPLHRDSGVPATVSVSEDCASGGQCWTRVYGRQRGFPQVIHSAKRFAGPTALEEYVGSGIGMALQVRALPDGLEFASDHYFVTLGQRHLRLPRWLEPGRTVVTHRDLGDGAFLFTLALHHPLLGELVYQEGKFHDG